MKPNPYHSLFNRAVVIPLAVLACASSARAAVYNWSGGAAGPWDATDLTWGGAGSTTPWDGANGPTNTATFDAITEPANAAIDAGGVHAGTLTLSGSQGVTLSGAGQLKLNNASGVGGVVNVNSGANLTLAASAGLLTTGLADTGSDPGGYYLNVGTIGSGTLTLQDTALIYLGFDRYLRTGAGGTVDVKGDNIVPWRVYFENNSSITVEGGSLVNRDNYKNSANRNGDWRSNTGAHISMSSGKLGGFNWSDMGLCTFDISGGLFLAGGNNNNNVGNGGATTFNLTGGEVLWAANKTITGQASAAVFNLGGTSLMDMRSITPGTGSVTFNFDGGTLKALVTNPDAGFMPASVVANIKAGGARIHTNGLNETVAATLLHDSGLGATADGGLSKDGLGTLTLTSGQTYTGATTVNAGTLMLGTGGSLAAASSVNLAAGSTFDVSALTAASATYTWNTSALSASGTGTVAGSTAATIAGTAGGTVAMGAAPMVLTWAGASSGNDATHPSLTITEVSLTLGGNQFTVVVPGTALGAGVYTLVSAGTISGSVNPTPLYTGGNGVASGGLGVVSISGGNSVILTVTSSGSPYENWANTHAGGQPANLDFDNDGVSNGVEYFMGAPAGFTANPAVVTTAGVRTVTWPLDPTATITSWMVQVSDNLSTWTNIVPPNASINTSDPTRVIYTLPSGTVKFCRLVVTP